MKLKRCASNFYLLEVCDNLSVYFSYETPIAFVLDGSIVAVQNRWGQTTGKHLNSVDGGSEDAKRRRLSEVVFNDALIQALRSARFEGSDFFSVLRPETALCQSDS